MSDQGNHVLSQTPSHSLCVESSFIIWGIQEISGMLSKPKVLWILQYLTSQGTGLSWICEQDLSWLACSKVIGSSERPVFKNRGAAQRNEAIYRDSFSITLFLLEALMLYSAIMVIGRCTQPLFTRPQSFLPALWPSTKYAYVQYSPCFTFYSPPTFICVKPTNEWDPLIFIFFFLTYQATPKYEQVSYTESTLNHMLHTIWSKRGSGLMLGGTGLAQYSEPAQEFPKRNPVHSQSRLVCSAED